MSSPTLEPTESLPSDEQKIDVKILIHPYKAPALWPRLQEHYEPMPHGQKHELGIVDPPSLKGTRPSSILPLRVKSTDKKEVEKCFEEMLATLKKLPYEPAAYELKQQKEDPRTFEAVNVERKAKAEENTEGTSA